MLEAGSVGSYVQLSAPVTRKDCVVLRLRLPQLSARRKDARSSQMASASACPPHAPVRPCLAASALPGHCHDAVVCCAAGTA